jgi:hypothetical protein
MINDIKKAAPFTFKGTISQFPLSSIINYITFSCILTLENNSQSGALFFKNGNLAGARSGNEFNINKADELFNWEEGEFNYQKIEKEIHTDAKHIKDILYLAELLSLNASIYIQPDNSETEIIISEGVIVNITPLPSDINKFLKKIIKSKEGDLIMIQTGGQTGNFKIYFSEIISNSTDTAQTKKKAPKPEKPSASAQKKEKIDINIIKQTFKYLSDTLSDSFLGGSLYTRKLGKPIYQYKTETNQSILFAKLHTQINELLETSGFSKIAGYYLLDLKDDFTVFILTFAEHHFGFVLKSSKLKLGYFLHIIKPAIIEEYKKAITQN